MSTNPDINKVLGKRLKAMRNKKKITRESLSEKIDVSARFLADVESGKVGISLSTLKSICVTLNVTSDYLLGLDNDESSLSDFSESELIIKRIDKEHLPYLNQVVTAFYEAINK